MLGVLQGKFAHPDFREILIFVFDLAEARAGGNRTREPCTFRITQKTGVLIETRGSEGSEG